MANGQSSTESANPSLSPSVAFTEGDHTSHADISMKISIIDIGSLFAMARHRQSVFDSVDLMIMVFMFIHVEKLKQNSQ